MEKKSNLKKSPQPPEPWYDLENKYVSVLCTYLNYKDKVLNIDSPKKPTIIGELRPTLLISGSSETKRDGVIKFELTESLPYRAQSCGCNPTSWWKEVVIVNPLITFTATAQTEMPIFMTWKTSQIETKSQKLVHLCDDNWQQVRNQKQESKYYLISIVVKSWNFDSTPAPNTRFSWICIAEGGGVFIPLA